MHTGYSLSLDLAGVERGFRARSARREREARRLERESAALDSPVIGVAISESFGKWITGDLELGYLKETIKYVKHLYTTDW